MSRQTLNIHNDFTGLSLVGFDATEIDLLSAVCHEMQNQGTTKVTIGFEKLRELSQYKGHDNDRLFEDLRSMDTKLAALNFKRSTDDTYMRFTLFPTFRLSIHSTRVNGICQFEKPLQQADLQALEAVS